jgi:hypothetical protein
MRLSPIALLALGVAGLVGVAARGARPFTYEPQPRWAEDPESEEVCKAIMAECSRVMKDGEIEASWGYAELYDADGYLVGIRTTASTGCKPLDEHMALSHRHFRSVFAKEGQPDLDDIRVELKPGTPKDAVRLIKTSETQVSMGC